ncbi:carboxypeptidase-like regulatory domain-containing protein [Hymenobacter sp. UYCo722]|uniref:carboxypeptidase-like regulatory domain-containing protein n=1 Tax=Hymenobacter sp. UYCo722 TaxID=3156335 RepID=UPI003392A454
MKLTLLAGLLLATAVGPAAAQSRLAGKILDAATGLPVPYASISMLNTTAGTTSNAEGEFELKTVLPGRLVVSELGHQRDTVAVAAVAAPLLVRLQPSSVALPEVTTGTYTVELIKQAYRELRRTNGRKTYGQAFYRQVTKLDGDPTEVQEMVWHAQTSNARVEGSALMQGRFAKRKAVLSYNNFSKFSKAVSFFQAEEDSLANTGVIGLRVAERYKLKLLGVTQNGAQELVEIDLDCKEPTDPVPHANVVIDAATHQILRLRIATTRLSTKSNNPLFKFKQQLSRVEFGFRPEPAGAVLEYLKIDYEASMSRALKSNLPIAVSSFIYFYSGGATPAAGVAYVPAKAGGSDLAAIMQTTYDPAFWQNNPVVKRTPLEDQVMKSFEQKGAFGTMLTP